MPRTVPGTRRRPRPRQRRLPGVGSCPVGTSHGVHLWLSGNQTTQPSKAALPCGFAAFFQSAGILLLTLSLWKSICYDDTQQVLAKTRERGDEDAEAAVWIHSWARARGRSPQPRRGPQSPRHSWHRPSGDPRALQSGAAGPSMPTVVQEKRARVETALGNSMLLGQVKERKWCIYFLLFSSFYISFEIKYKFIFSYFVSSISV